MRSIILRFLAFVAIKQHYSVLIGNERAYFFFASLFVQGEVENSISFLELFFFKLSLGTHKNEMKIFPLFYAA